jgi:Ca2+-binding EF-hand superfamily protein
MKTTLAGGILAGLLASGAMAEAEHRPGGDRPQRDGEKEPLRGNPKEMFMRMDRDGDGKVSKREFFASPRMERLPVEKREEIFVRLDRDGDGFLTRREIRAMRQDAERRVRDGFRKLDTDGSGGLSFEEFSKGKFADKLPEERRLHIFRRLDTDGDGEITSADRPRGRPGPPWKPERRPERKPKD